MAWPSRMQAPVRVRLVELRDVVLAVNPDADMDSLPVQQAWLITLAVGSALLVLAYIANSGGVRSSGSSGGGGPSRSPFGRASRGADGLPLTDQHRLRCEGG